MGDLGKRHAKISQTAARQYGHITREQLLGLGMGARTIGAWVVRGRLITVHTGIYSVDYVRPEPIADAAAAVLACGPTAVLSHDSAAALWHLRRWPRTPEVTVTTDRRRPTIQVHRSTTLRPGDVTVQLGIRVTRPGRTLADIRPRLTPARFQRVTNDARISHIIGDDAAERLLHHRRGPTRSELEDAFQRFITRHRLPQPHINARLGGDEVDALFSDQRLIVELDGWDTHRGRAAFATDRERDAAHAEAGYLTIRITWERLRDQPRREADRLRRILDRRRNA